MKKINEKKSRITMQEPYQVLKSFQNKDKGIFSSDAEGVYSPQSIINERRED